MRELNYLVKIEGNESLLERFIEAIDNNTTKIDKAYEEKDKIVPKTTIFLAKSIIKNSQKKF